MCMTVGGNKPSGNKDFRRMGTGGGNGTAQQPDLPWRRVSRISGHVSPSGRASEIDDLVDAVRALPDVRVDKVAAIRKAIESGTYVVDAAKIAQKMIEEIRCPRACRPDCDSDTGGQRSGG